MKGIRHGIIHCLLYVLVLTAGCALSGGRQSTSGPSRGNNPISGDLTNADITINDPRLFYGIVAVGIIGVAGFMVLGWRLARHHASIGRISAHSVN
jgi:hypothetical protein